MSVKDFIELDIELDIVIDLVNFNWWGETQTWFYKIFDIVFSK